MVDIFVCVSFFILVVICLFAPDQKCPECGGKLEEIDEHIYQCKRCKTKYIAL